VVLKTLRREGAAGRDYGRFQREYEITRSLSGDDLIRAYDLVEYENSPAIVLEDFGGDDLLAHLQGKALPAAEFLPLAVQISRQLAGIHSQHLMHKDINPANIVWNRESGVVKIIDFGLATTLSREKPEIRSPNVLEGTLLYISPEQTGRMNRAMDYRSDFYSLGVTFYQMLTGRLPFTADNALALVHAHMARQPIPPAELNPAIPSVLSDIVLRLMAKNAEDRYQSAAGLQADLERCRREWQAAAVIPSFPLAQQDVNARFQLPQKLYGRDRERQVLLDAFDRAADPQQGDMELLLVSGPPGIGKSALVREIHLPVTARRGYFVSGKFDQLTNTPYAPLLRAVQDLVNQILLESEEALAVWREQLTAALGKNGQVIVDVVPALEWIIGPQTAVPELPPTETENRFNLAFFNFIRVVARPEHPLVVFLDDWQWMDAASRKFLQAFITSGKVRHFLMIGAYRDNEVGAGHPIENMLNAIAQAGVRQSQITLSSLSPLDVNRFVADTLHRPLPETEELAALVHRKTDGNPFFVGEFLKALFAAGWLTFDFAAGRWQWELNRIQAQNITDNVVALMTGNIQKLAEPAQEKLKLAACIGSRFDVQTLALAAGQSPQATAVDLWPAVAEGVVIPLDESYTLLTVADPDETLNARYKFAHDRIQQAAYSLLPDEEKTAVHWQIGRNMWAAVQADGGNGDLFAAANQLNLGQAEARSPAEWRQLAELNLQAGQMAVAGSAYQPAYQYLTNGLGQLARLDDFWSEEYDLALALRTSAAEAAYLSGQYEEMERLAADIMAHARQFLDEVPVHMYKIQALSAQNRLMETIDFALPVLRKLGVNLPQKPNRRHLATAVLRLRLALRGKSIESLLELPRLSDPTMIAAGMLMTHLGVAAYFVNTELFALIVLQLALISVKYGNYSFSCRNYVAYGLMLCGPLRDIEAGYRFGQLGVALTERLDAPEVKAAAMLLLNNFVRHWKENLRAAIPALQEAYQIGLETGDLQFASFSGYAECATAFYAGLELSPLIAQAGRYSEAMIRFKQEKILYVHRLFQQSAANLAGETAVPYELAGSYYDENEIVPQYAAANDNSALCTYYVQKGLLCYLFNQNEQAQTALSQAEPLLGSIVGSYVAPVFYFYDSLNQLALYADVETAERQRILEKVTANQKKMAYWEQYCPANFANKHRLAAAEQARVLGKTAEARELYDTAVDLAHENGFLHEEALAYELAGRFYLERGNGRLAHHYLQQAYYGYSRWGAAAKAERLVESYPAISLRAGESGAPSSLTLTDSSPISTSQSSAASLLDFASIIKASQALSGEIVLARLLARLMDLVIENAGARSGCLLLEEAGEWQPAAYGGEMTAEWTPPPAIINYVARSQKSVVLDDAAQSDQFAFALDAVVIERGVKSLLCMPLLNQGELTGILYLENDLATGAFTRDRLAVLQALAAQAAISIENARLYGRLEEHSRTLEQQVTQRTAQLARATQEAQAARAAAEQASANKSAFLANMSHELRTPLNAIIGFTRIVKRRSSDVLPEKQIDNLDKVLVSARNLLQLINTILDIAKIEAGRVEVYFAPFDVGELVALCVDTIRPLLRDGVVLQSDVPPALPPLVSDQAKVRQILINLL
ncbi:MAG TPA: GAF domain-containing protein, partial [Anaerolineae bacterium]|nr:GAF domain-containing protein [Anaerolineae bacterium]